MSPRIHTLTRIAAVAAMLAGAIFIAVQINHPPMHAESAATADWVVRSFAKASMAALALVALTGMYLRQRREMKWLGFAGYIVFAAGYLLMFSVEIVAATVLPTLVGRDRGYVEDVIVVAAGGAAQGDIGGLALVLNLSGVGYMLGGLLFGIALFRAGILSRAASVLLAVGTIATASLAVLPEGFNRPLAVPVGVALITLGVSLWRGRRLDASVAAPAPAVVDVAR